MYADSTTPLPNADASPEDEFGPLPTPPLLDAYDYASGALRYALVALLERGPVVDFTDADSVQWLTLFVQDKIAEYTVKIS